ncbi:MULTISPECIES: RNA polymerase sigma factor SigI [unclassified Mycolicibacterium]|uniref:RNA polymerase sigma factor SigI n=1 Tax=unclassified Mycolicibacterium TaxID=2636767 RepID=UPI000EBF3F91|nr:MULTISPECIES: RNA polymerase sigma factor SigI [unclassified Mycolicibacterium]BCI80808.1 putative alternative RNA polymerase SigI [Mycolicibacterium sp. TY66]BCJ81531.1 putative alternative RNA polymerase SigI [Mycolicibacterium sp. TY81]GCB00597.1 putative alternative RNA polymerase SigI [Mycolicibacterium sp. NCC-Tsukiji]
MTETTEFTAAWRHHHPYLVNLAYQMLGDVGDAEDVAQEAFLRLSRTLPGEIEDVRAWLTTVAGRLCLDLVRSARARREQPTEQDAMPPLASRELDPADRVTLDDEVSSALLRVLRQLSPGERVAFILHDVFAVPFESIAETVGRPVGTCRQLARRARAKVAGTDVRADDVEATDHQLVTEKFITACAGGDVQALAAVLDPTVWGVGTVLSDPPIPPIVNHGPQRVAENLMLYLGPGTTVVAGPLGQPVLLAFAHRQLFAVVVLTIRDGLVAKIEATADPLARFGA